MNMWVFLGVFALYLAILRWVIGAARKTALKEGFQHGYQEGFTDAQKYSPLWWQVADDQVSEMREKIRNEEGWS